MRIDRVNEVTIASGNVHIQLAVADGEDGERLDRLIADRVAEMSRSSAQQLVKAGNVLVNGETARPAARVRSGDQIALLLPPVPAPVDLAPEYMPIPIVYEDDDVIVFDKPPGLVTHPAPGHERGTLVNALRALRPDLPLIADDRPGIVHRLDKDTSGLIVVAKNESARLFLLRQWQRRDVVKRYTALVHGAFGENEGTVDAPIARDPNNRKRMAVVVAGRRAVTHFRVRERLPGSTLLDIEIETGRTHQIRVHMLFIGHPVVGDKTYGARPFPVPLSRQFLHASGLQFDLPESGRPIELDVPLPEDLRTVLAELRLEGMS